MCQKNMRLSEDEKEFSIYVLRVGDGNPLPTEMNEFDEDEEDQLILLTECWSRSSAQLHTNKF